MLAASQVLSIIPDQAGKGGSKTVLSTFATNLDIRIAHNFMVFDGRWRTVPLAEDYGLNNFPQAAQSYSLHNYLSYDTSNAALLGDSVILGHLTDDLTSTNEIWNYTIGFSIRAGKTTPNSYTPAVFVNIKNRCFICWGGDDNFIISDPTLTFDDPAKIYDVGVNPPETPPTYTLQGFLDRGTAGLDLITYTTGSNKVNGVSANLIANPPPIFVSNTKAISIDGVVYQVQSPGGYFFDNFPAIGTANIDGTSGTDQLTIGGFIFPGNGDYNGLQINIGSGAEIVTIQSYVELAGDTVVTLTANLSNTHTNATGVISGEQFVLTTAYTGPTAFQTGFIRMFFGELSWTGQGPQYAYAYYDPITGHVSNASPILQITEQDQPGVNVELTNIMPSVVSDQDRFTQIIIFRTLLAGGAVLFPISTAFVEGDFEHVANSGGAKTYTDDNPDSALLVAGGLQAPITTNRKPPIFTHMAYWDTRLWGNPVEDPSAVVFSGDPVQVPFGVPEESFPSTNQLRVPADDGRVTGMQLIGSTLVVATERYSYFVDGNNELNYRLTRFGSGTYGVGDYQMFELPGDTSETASAVLYLGRDSRLYLMAPAYGNVCVSDPIANIIKEAIGIESTQFYLARVHYFTAPNQRLAIISLPPSVANPSGLVVMYDFDRKIWFQCYARNLAGDIVRPQAFATIYGGTRPVDLIFAAGGNVYAWMRNDDATPGPADAYLELPVLDFGQPKYRKQIAFVRLYTNAPDFTVEVWPNEAATAISQFAQPEPDPLRSIYQSDSIPTDAITTKELVTFPLSALTATGFDRMQAYRFRIRLTQPTNTTRYEVYKIDIGWSILEDPSEVSI
jgi:hypothetical protein